MTVVRSTALVRLAAALLLAAPTSAVSAPATSALAAALDEVLSRGSTAGARVGACVVSLDSGATLYARDADALLNPASNVKLFTAAAALARLGPEFRFETELAVDAASVGLPRGAARTLFVRGKGDPSLVTERLQALVADLSHLGLRRVGDLVLDDLWFDAVRVGAGFDQENGDKAYLAPAGALSLNYNAVAVHVGPGDRPGAPGRVEVEPDSAWFEVVNHVVTVGPRAARRLTIASVALPAGRQRILVAGRVPVGGRTSVHARKIDDPPRYLGETLRRLLEQRGIRVTGRIRTGAVPPDARLLLVVESEELGEIVRRLQKTSNNFIAEQLVKSLGAASAGPPGTWAGGLAAIESFLGELGIPRGSYVMKNGSGLNDANRFSARQVTRLLGAMWRRFPASAEFLAALPVAGKDGTLRARLEGTEAVGQVRAKTGTLEGVVSLSGYLETSARERLAFAILVNDHGGRSGAVTRAVDEVVAVLVRGGLPRVAAAATASPAPGPAAGSAEATGASPAPSAAVEATIRTYLALGRSADRRNAAFLRTALLAEVEPAVRLAVAEALYRSDPDSGAAQRGLLEALPAGGDPAALLPVLAAADPSDPTPALAALGDLAAEGSGEALARLVSLTTATAPALTAPLTAVLSDLADAVPDELREAIGAAHPATRDRAAALLGDKLSGLAGPASGAPAIGPAPGPAKGPSRP